MDFAPEKVKIFRNLKLRRIQCDQIWSFVGCKEKNATDEHKAGSLEEVIALVRQK